MVSIIITGMSIIILLLFFIILANKFGQGGRPSSTRGHLPIFFRPRTRHWPRLFSLFAQHPLSLNILFKCGHLCNFFSSQKSLSIEQLWVLFLRVYSSLSTNKWYWCCRWWKNDNKAFGRTTGWCRKWVCKKVASGSSRPIYSILSWDCQSCIDQLSPRFFIYKLGDVPSLPWGAGKWQI